MPAGRRGEDTGGRGAGEVVFFDRGKSGEVVKVVLLL